MLFRSVYTTTVIKVTDTEAIHDNGLVTDLLGNQLRSRGGFSNSPAQLVPLEFSVGRRWSVRTEVTDPKGGTFTAEQTIRILRREAVTVPAGSFNPYLLEGRGQRTNPAGPIDFVIRRWYVPEFQRPVAREQVNRRDKKIIGTERLELVAYKLA